MKEAPPNEKPYTPIPIPSNRKEDAKNEEVFERKFVFVYGE